MSFITTIGPKSARKYRARWRTPDGRSRSRTFARKVDAQHHLDSVGVSVAKGTYVDPKAGKVTFRAFAESWRAMQVHRPGTTKSVEQQLRLHVYPHLGGRPIGAVRPSEIQAMVQRLGMSLAPSTVEVIYGRVVAVFRAAIRDRVITTSPCVAVRRPPSAPASALQVAHQRAGRSDR
jgi:Phage integrase central domain